MRTFWVAICILLIMLGAILLINAYLLNEVDAMAKALSAFPPSGNTSCLSEASALEARWQSVRSLAALAVNGRTVAEIDRLTVSLRAIAASSPMQDTEWERHRALLHSELRALRVLLGCSIWEIV